MVAHNRHQFVTRQYISIMAIAILSLLGMVGILYATPWGIGISPDSVAYIHAARDLLAGEGLNTTHFAPLYPVLLAVLVLGKIFGGDPLNTARWLNAIFFGGNVFLVGLLIYRYSSGLKWPPIVGSLLILVSIPMLTIHLMAWTEPAFIFFGLAGLWLLAFYLEHAGVMIFVASALLISLAFLTRYAGVALVLTGFIGILLFSKKNLLKRFLVACTFAFLGSAPMMLWLIRNMMVAGTATNREIVFHPINRSHIWSAIFTFTGWFLVPDSASNIFRLALGIVILLGVALILFARYRKQKSSSRPILADIADAPQLIKLLLLFIVVYGFFLVVSISFLDANTPLDNRILSPIFVTAVILLMYLLSQVVQAFTLSPVVQTALVSGLILFLGLCISTSYPLLSDSLTNGLGFSNASWHNSEIIKMADQLPDGVSLISNSPEVLNLYIHTDRPIAPLPRKTNAITRQVNQEYSSELASIRNQIANEESVILYFGNLRRDAEQTIMEIDRELPLCILGQINEDIIYGIAECQQ